MAFIAHHARLAKEHFETALGLIGGSEDDARASALQGMIELAETLQQLEQALKEVENLVRHRT